MQARSAIFCLDDVLRAGPVNVHNPSTNLTCRFRLAFRSTLLHSYYIMVRRSLLLLAIAATASTTALKISAGRRLVISALTAIPLGSDAMLPGSAMFPGSGVSGGPWFTTSITPERKAEIRANSQSRLPGKQAAWRIECEPGDEKCVAERKQKGSPTAQLAGALRPVSKEERSAAIRAQSRSCRLFCDKELPGSLR